MARRHEHAYSLNAGGVDVEALSRVDLEKMRISGQHPVRNWFPRVLGPMSLRPGLEHLARNTGDAETHMVRYVREIGISYILRFSELEMRVALNGVVQQVPVVSSTVDTGLWLSESTGAATATPGATLTFNATSTDTARLKQRINIAADDREKANILRIVVDIGPVYLRIGTTDGGQEVRTDTRLDAGTHKLAITPDASTDRVWLEMWTSDDSTKTVSQIQFESTLLGNVEGDLVLPTPWTIEQAKRLRTWGEVDLVFCGDGENWPQRIEHRGSLSWSICRHYTDNGPFSAVANRLMTITPSALRGNVTLTASDAYWSTEHVGCLVELTQRKKIVQLTLNGADQSTDYVSITDIKDARKFSIQLDATGWTGTLILERSLQAGEPTVWTTYKTYTGALAATVIADNLENVTAHYKVRVSAYTAGSMVVTLTHESGIATGIARITGFTSTSVVDAEVLTPFGNAEATREWRIGTFNGLAGFPRVPIIRDSRMYWFRGDVAYGSVVDDYTNYDDNVDGDSGPLIRSVGSGTSAGVLWALDMQRMLVGTATFETPIQASDFGEVITAAAWTVPKASFRGSADVQAVAYDDGAFFVQRSRRKLYELSIPSGESRVRSQDISRLNPAACKAGIKRIAVQQQPMVRAFAVLDDGTCVVVTFEKDDKVIAFTTLETDDGFIEDVEVEPDVDQDNVYFQVKRNSTQRYFERLAPEIDQEDPDTCALLDSHTVFTGSVSSLGGLQRFAGQTVEAWADGARIDDLIITAGGSCTLPATYSRVVVGLNVEHEFQSVKLAYAAQIGTALGALKTIKALGLILSRSCLDGLRIGRSEAESEGMPEMIAGAERTPNQFFEHFDDRPFPIAGVWDTDARFWIGCDSSEGPCTVQSVVIDIETRDDAPTRNG